FGPLHPCEDLARPFDARVGAHLVVGGQGVVLKVDPDSARGGNGGAGNVLLQFAPAPDGVDQVEPARDAGDAARVLAAPLPDCVEASAVTQLALQPIVI